MVSGMYGCGVCMDDVMLMNFLTSITQFMAKRGQGNRSKRSNSKNGKGGSKTASSKTGLKGLHTEMLFGRQNYVLLAVGVMLIVAGFTGSAGRQRTFNDENKTLTNAVDLIVSPFGSYKVVLNRVQMSTHAFLLDPSMWRSAVLRPFTRTLLAKTGDSEKHFLSYEGGLMHLNPKASGMINQLS